MSTYIFAPSADLATREEVFGTWENGFSESEITKIRNLGDSLVRSQATVSGGELLQGVRKSEVAWIGHDDESSWIYDKLAWIARQINGTFFEFDLFGFVEHFQYTVYGSKKDHYDWHMDKGVMEDGSPPRKLSLVLQLSDPSEYDGGDLQFKVGTDPITADKKQGLVYAFPSWVLHRVTPVTRGTRRSLVIWISGPKFR